MTVYKRRADNPVKPPKVSSSAWLSAYQVVDDGHRMRLRDQDLLAAVWLVMDRGLSIAEFARRVDLTEDQVRGMARCLGFGFRTRSAVPRDRYNPNNEEAA